MPLEPGAFVWFTPGTIHRLVNGGDLEILVLMQNAGLPEAGDMVITFPPEVLATAEAYAAAATLPEDERTSFGSGDAARARRDLAVPTFNKLREATEAGDPAPLRAFHEAAARLVQPHIADWTKRWHDGPLQEVERTGDLLRALAEGDPDHLAEAERPPPCPATRRAPHGLLRHPGHLPPLRPHVTRRVELDDGAGHEPEPLVEGLRQRRRCERRCTSASLAAQLDDGVHEDLHRCSRCGARRARTRCRRSPSAHRSAGRPRGIRS